MPGLGVPGAGGTDRTSPRRPGRRAAGADDVDPAEAGAEVRLATDSFARPSFTLEQLRTFLVVASREHVTHAAHVLRLSQPAVTQQIQLLERALGVQLLERVGRNVRLTSAGAEVAGACLLVMRALENLEDVARAVRGLDLGTVTVAASPLAAAYQLPQAIVGFSADYPHINLVVAVFGAQDVCHQVVSGHVECGLVEGSPTPGGNLVRASVSNAEVVLVAHPDHPVATDGRTDPLHGARLLVWDTGVVGTTIATRLLGPAADRAPRLLIGSIDMARRMVLTAPGFVTALPVAAVREDLRSGALNQIMPRPVAVPIVAVRRPGAATPAVEALWQALTAA